MPRTPLARRALIPAASAVLLAACALPGVSTVAVAAPARPARPGVSGTTALTTVRLSVGENLGWAPFDSPKSVTVPTGWTASVWARPTKARLEAWTPDGQLLVSRPVDGAVTILQPSATGRPSSRSLITGLKQPHGLAFDGSTLYVGESNRIDSYPYADGKVGARTTVIDGLPDTGGATLGGAYAHALKSVAVGLDHALYFSIGSTENVSAYDRGLTPERATVMRVAPGAHTATVYARGVRNGTGLAVAPDGAVWTAVNNRDNVSYPYHQDYDGNGSDDYGKVLTGYVNDHPVEPLARLFPGRDLGWPYCNPDPDVTPGSAKTALDYSYRGFVRDALLNPDGSKLDCSTLRGLEQGLPAHSAPLGLSFTRTPLPGLGTGALVGVHGSWNRTPPRAPEVAFFPYADGRLSDQQTIMSGFQSSSGKRWGRPVAAVQGPDGAIYVSDDQASAIYRLAPPA